jgi:8-oxo-dGTP pyrophosphatase MutT (NUDIX family)
VYENAWIKVREDQVLSPSGKPGIYGVVEPRIAVGVVALTDAHEIFLVGQYRYPLDVYSWEIPEGGGEEDEPALVTAQRELREETGLLATSWDTLGAEVHVSNCHSSERGFLFIARGLTQAEAAPDETELLQLKKVPFRDALKMVEDGTITDGLSIIAILKTARLLGM